MQRLFSTFANGWPGVGLLLQRALAGTLLLYCGTLQASERSHMLLSLPVTLGAIAGLFLFAGLGTPVAGTAAFLAETWNILIGTKEPILSAAVATLSVSIAMIGPGAWSMDARMFGRKHIESRTPSKL